MKWIIERLDAIRKGIPCNCMWYIVAMTNENVIGIRKRIFRMVSKNKFLSQRTLAFNKMC